MVIVKFIIVMAAISCAKSAPLVEEQQKCTTKITTIQVDSYLSPPSIVRYSEGEFLFNCDFLKKNIFQNVLNDFEILKTSDFFLITLDRNKCKIKILLVTFNLRFIYCRYKVFSVEFIMNVYKKNHI